MFNKKNGPTNNTQGNNAPAPVAPPQMRKPASIAPLPPKRKEVTIPQPTPPKTDNIKPAINSNITFIANDILVTGTIISNGEIIIEGTIEGEVRARKITIKNNATITGELVSEELIIHGKVNGIVRGINILLASDCILNGEILHETLSIESGAQFEGSCKRSDNPLAEPVATKKAAPKTAVIKPLAEANKSDVTLEK